MTLYMVMIMMMPMIDISTIINSTSVIVVIINHYCY